MKLARDPMGVAEGRAMLDQLPVLYFAVLRSARIEQLDGAAGICCSFELPILGRRTKTAPTVRDAIRAVLIDLSEVLTKVSIDEWPEDWFNLVSSVPSTMRSGISKEQGRNERFQSKVRQFTIGVTMPSKLKLALQETADEQETTFADVARQFVNAGFEDFDERSFSESPEVLLFAFSNETREWPSSESEQVMVRLDPHLAVRLRSAAKEYCRSVSEFGVMCLVHGVFLQTLVTDVEKKVVAMRGSAIRQLAPKIGLGRHVALLSSILAGTIAAPRKVLRCLSEVLDAPEFVLAAFFRRSFAIREVPAFKANKGKPQVFHSITPWQEAVKSLNLPEDESKELLLLDE